MKALRIALVMIEPPVPFGNAAGRWFYVLLKGLEERGHRVTAFATCSQAQEIEEARGLFAPPQFNLRCYPHARRSSIMAKWETLRRPHSFMFSADLRRDLCEELGRGVDVLHLEQVSSGWLGLDQTAHAVVNVHHLYQVDLAPHPVDSLRGSIARRLTYRAERGLLRHYSHITTLSPELSARVRLINPAAQVTTIPLALDASLYQWRNRAHQGAAPTVSLIGSFNWLPTYSAALRVLTQLWPEIRRRVPTARLRMVGRDAAVALRAFRDAPNVEFHENVPDAIPFFYETDVLLYPLAVGSGMKVKVLEALALGTPVVTTRAGVEGLPAEDGIHAGVCEDDRGLIERTVDLLIDDARRERQRVAALALLESHCSPRASLDALEGVYSGLCEVGARR